MPNRILCVSLIDDGIMLAEFFFAVALFGVDFYGETSKNFSLKNPVVFQTFARLRWDNVDKRCDVKSSISLCT